MSQPMTVRFSVIKHKINGRRRTSVLFCKPEFVGKNIKVLVELLQKLVGFKRAKPFVALRRVRNSFSLKSAGREQKQSGVTVFAWGTLAGGSPFHL